MRRMDLDIGGSMDTEHRREGYAGALASTGNGGKEANVNNLYNSQVRGIKAMMPYGISSRPKSGVKAQTIVNDNDDTTMVGVFDPSRPSVGVGEICIYSAGKCEIFLDSSGKITIKSPGDIDIIAGGNINLSCNKFNLNERG